MSNLFTVRTEVSVHTKDIENLLCSALEGGSTYWCEEFELLDEYPEGCTYGHEAVARGACFLAYHDEQEVVKVFPSLSKISETLQLMADEHPYHFHNLIDGNDDAETGDVFFQLLCFGEVVYG